MKREPFNIKFKEKIISGKAKLTLGGLPVRIVCWDRKGLFPIIGLIMNNSEFNFPEVIIEIDNKGTVCVPGRTATRNDLYVEYDPIGVSKRARVVYSLLRLTCIEKYMRKYGYEENEEKGHYWNAVQFANIYAKSHTKELHDDLKANGDWEYDDDYDWD